MAHKSRGTTISDLLLLQGEEPLGRSTPQPAHQQPNTLSSLCKRVTGSAVAADRNNNSDSNKNDSSRRGGKKAQVTYDFGIHDRLSSSTFSPPPPITPTIDAAATKSLFSENVRSRRRRILDDEEAVSEEEAKEDAANEKASRDTVDARRMHIIVNNLERLAATEAACDKVGAPKVIVSTSLEDSNGGDPNHIYTNVIYSDEKKCKRVRYQLSPPPSPRRPKTPTSSERSSPADSMTNTENVSKVMHVLLEIG